MTIMGYFTSSVDNNVRLDVLSIIIGFFISLTSMMLYLWLLNYHSTYFFIFSLNLFNWYFASLCLEMILKTSPNSSTLPLKLHIYGMF